jgi:arginyl-tRNA--protein-N-Asp/Glu arginylyltransferase
MDKAAKVRFREFMDSCELTRYDQLEADFQKDKDFLKLSKEYDKLYNQLKECLSESQLELLKRYEDVLHNIGIQRGFAFYKNGFMDASELIQILVGGSKSIKLNVQIV